MRISTIFAAIATGVYSLAVVGFWFHTDAPPADVFGKYSTAYFAVLALLAALIPVVFILSRELFRRQTMRLWSGRVIEVPVSVNLLLFVGTAIVGVTLAEMRLRSTPVSGHREELSKFHPFLQIVNKPNDNWLNTNRWALRGEEIEKQKDDLTYRIIVLGGSTVLCDTVTFEQTHCRIAELLLRSKYEGAVIEVLNAGTNWHTSEHSLISFLFDLQDFNPDLIIVLHAINDLYRGFSPETYARGKYRPDYGHFVGPVGSILDTYEYGQQTAFLSMKNIRNAFDQYWCSDLRVVSRHPLDAIEISEWRSLPAFERNMTDLVKIAKSKGIQVVLATQPSLYRDDLSPQEQSNIWFPRTFCVENHRTPSLESMVRGMAEFNDVTRQIAAREDVILIDLERVVPKTLDYLSDDVHYTKKGNQHIGETVAAAIIESKSIDVEMNRRKEIRTE